MRYTRLSDAELDEVLWQLVGENEEMGANAARARLSSMGV